MPILGSALQRIHQQLTDLPIIADEPCRDCQACACCVLLPISAQWTTYCPLYAPTGGWRTLVVFAVRCTCPRCAAKRSDVFDCVVGVFRCCHSGAPAPDRNNSVTVLYANAAREVARELDTAVVDIWTLFKVCRVLVSFCVVALPEVLILRSPPAIALRLGFRLTSQDGFPDSWKELLRDGLHLSREGSRLTFAELRKVLVTTWPELDPERMSFDMPAHQEVVSTDLDASFPFPS